MKKNLFWNIFVVSSLLTLTSCEELLNVLLSDNPIPNTSGYNYNATAPDTVYVSLANQPDANNFLPGYPLPGSADFMDDEIQYQWGKDQRTTSRGETAYDRMGRTPKVMCQLMARVLGIESIDAESTPALERLLHRAYRTGEQSVIKARQANPRKRPFVEFGDAAWYSPDADETSGCYASATTAAGWAVALAYAEMWPALQENILRRGFQFGEDRVISGSNYQSDVDAGYLCASASMIIAHRNSKLQNDILAAREELRQLKGGSYSAGDPDGSGIFNAPVINGSTRYEADLKRYEYAKETYRGTDRGQQAIEDASYSDSHMNDIFGQAAGTVISASRTPAIHTLIQAVRIRSQDCSDHLKGTNFRVRPYVQLNESTPVPDQEEDLRYNSSYPSGHACLAWAMGLILSEVAPNRSDKILKRAYDYGYNRLIVGYHWVTDIEVGRQLASTVITHMHTEDLFNEQMKAAQEEYTRLMNQ